MNDNRGGAPCRFGDVTEKVFRWLGRKNSGASAASLMISRSWKDIVGERMAENVTPGLIRKDGTLIVYAVTSAWMNEVRCLKHQLLGRLRSVTGAKNIKRICIKRGDPQKENPVFDNTERSCDKNPGRELSATELRRVENAVSCIKDDALRKRLYNIFENALRFGRNTP